MEPREDPESARDEPSGTPTDPGGLSKREEATRTTRGWPQEGLERPREEERRQEGRKNDYDGDEGVLDARGGGGRRRWPRALR